MSQNVSFWRKVAYVAAIALLLFPLYLIGRPRSPDDEGGKLAQLSWDHGLSQAKLGEIDPASESMKLATLGMRGVAANLLWQKAFDYKMREEWDNFSATTNQITKLQPHYIMIWEFQAHNLAYNVSVEFDDYRHRYHWVKKGISFLIDGIEYNRENPRLLHYAGWITGQKIGRADEHVQFREMFREDDDFHRELSAKARLVIDDAYGYDPSGGRSPDNWLVSRLWYLRAERSVDEGSAWRGKNIQLYSDDPLRGKSPLVFRNDAPMSLINYASTIEEEGIHGPLAQRAWFEADRGWMEFGKRPIPTSWGHVIRLGDYDSVRNEIALLRERFDGMTPGYREQINKEKIAALTQEERNALNTPEEEITDRETYELWYAAREKTKPSYEEIAERAAPEYPEEVVKLAERLTSLEKRLGDNETPTQEIVDMRGRFQGMTPDIAKRIKQKKIAALSPELRDALEGPKPEINDDAYPSYLEAIDKTKVSHKEVATRAAVVIPDKIIKTPSRITAQELLLGRIAHYRGIINYDYWTIRCKAEQTKIAVDARESLFEARKKRESVEPTEACKLYEQTWHMWREVFDKYDRLKDDVEAEELVKSIRSHRRLLQALDQDLSKDFILRDLLEGKEGFSDLFPSETVEEDEEEGAADSKEDAGESVDGENGDSPPASDATAKPAPDADPSP